MKKEQKQEQNPQSRSEGSRNSTALLQKELTHLEKILKNLPKTPGVYQMKDKGGRVIYVGKAKNLRSRVNSYFDRTTDLSVAKRQMVGKIADIEIITCQTEVEALVLETNLIKHLTPKYNILMKDDKNLAYIKITKNVIPEVIKTRQKIADGAEYFGPYVSAVEKSLRELKRIFRVRNCRVKFEQGNKKGTESDGDTSIRITDKAGRNIPCIDYYIGLCPAPCLLKKENMEEHNRSISHLRNFLRGDTGDVFHDLESEMKQKAREMNFEEAARLRDTLESLKNLHEKQNVRDCISGDHDIVVIYEKYEKVYLGFTEVRDGQVVSVQRREVEIGIDEKNDAIEQFLVDRYMDNEEKIGLLLMQPIEDDALIAFLSEKRITMEVPKIGSKKNLLDFTLTQLREYAYKNELATLEQKTLSREHMAHVLQSLSYLSPDTGEIVFECYDISHTDGHFTYASRVAIVNGKPDSSRYKKYKIKSLWDGQIDDFASHREVMRRRVLEGIELDNFPHLIIIDGGKGQLSSAILGAKEGVFEVNSLAPVILSLSRNPEKNKDSLREARFLTAEEGQKKVELQICSIAKREEEIFLPNQREPILFEKGSPELMLLQKARDEAHRFSITANKSARMKSMKKNILEEIPGIGPVTRKKLLSLAGSIDGIKDLYPEELSDICTTTQIEALRDHGIIT